MLKKIVLFLVLFSVALFAAVQITNMNDFVFGLWSVSGGFQATDNICIHKNKGNAKYNITATGSGSGGAFTVTNGSHTIPYTAEFSGSKGGFVNLTSGTKTQFQDRNNTVNCGGGTNAQLRITITEANLFSAYAGNYSGTLTLLLQD